MLYVSKKARNVRQDRFDSRIIAKRSAEPTVIESAVITNDINVEKIEPTVIETPVEVKRKPKKSEKVGKDKEEKVEEDGRE